MSVRIAEKFIRVIFFQCFDTVGLVIWPVKIVPDMIYNVTGGTLNPALSIYLKVTGSKATVT